MKKLICFGLVSLALIGCKEKSTGVEYNVLNAAGGGCIDKLTSLLKSPSSLKLNTVNIYQEQPSVLQVLGIKGRSIIDEKTSSIKQLTQDSGVYFRNLRVVIDYEAQNSFGAMLRDDFSCTFMYSRYPTSANPDFLEWVQINQKGEVADFVTGQYYEPSIEVKKYSKWKLDSKINNVYSNVGAEPNVQDDTMLNDVLELYKENRTPKRRVEPISDQAAQAAKDATEAAQAAARELGW